jgi:hypothetical protein
VSIYLGSKSYYLFLYNNKYLTLDKIIKKYYLTQLNYYFKIELINLFINKAKRKDMPSKIRAGEAKRREERRAREARKKIPWIIFLTCSNTELSEELDKLQDEKYWSEHYIFPLKKYLAEFEKHAKKLASHLYVHFEQNTELSDKEKENWQLKIRIIKASNPELQIFYNDKAREIIPRQVMGKVILKREIKGIIS